MDMDEQRKAVIQWNIEMNMERIIEAQKKAIMECTKAFTELSESLLKTKIALGKLHLDLSNIKEEHYGRTS